MKNFEKAGVFIVFGSATSQEEVFLLVLVPATVLVFIILCGAPSALPYNVGDIVIYYQHWGFCAAGATLVLK
eukprot:scaffold656239_cov90-Attheya_sp.AAC.2